MRTREDVWATPRGSEVWACPACDKGWQVYMIATDMNVCSRCGYKGGDPKKWRETQAELASKLFAGAQAMGLG